MVFEHAVVFTAVSFYLIGMGKRSQRICFRVEHEYAVLRIDRHPVPVRMACSHHIAVLVQGW